MVLKMYEPGMVLFATPQHEFAIDEAKKYCLQNNLTPEDVKILKIENMVIVKKR